ncbi:MAG TPA: hypothetical protein VGI60_02735 [Chthoniobacterales bacterium]|jgi:hypothetical protein
MSTEFTDELRKSLSDFVQNTSDSEFYQALKDADYEFFSKVEEPKYTVTRGVSFSTVTYAKALDVKSLTFRKALRAITMEPELKGIDHQDLALAA